LTSLILDKFVSPNLITALFCGAGAGILAIYYPNGVIISSVYVIPYTASYLIT